MKGLNVIQAFGPAIVSFAMCVSTAGAQVLPFDQAKERADTGDAFAQAIVAMHYQLGWNTEKNLEQAAKYATASSKARSPLGYFRVGTMIRNGEVFAKDEKKGLELQAASHNTEHIITTPNS
jgi:TPR repeat protein